MKIVVVGNRCVNVLKDRLTAGGGELNERDQLRLLSKNHEVLWYTNAGSEDLQIPNVTMVRLQSQPAWDHVKGKRAAITRRRNRECRERIAEDKPDVVVAQDCSNVGLAKVLLDLGVPSVWHHHSPWDQSGFRNLLGLLPVFKKLVEAGHVVATVSEANRAHFNSALLKKGGSMFDGLIEGVEENPGMFLSDIIYPYTLWEKPVVQEATNGFVVIGRLSAPKRLHLPFQSFKRLGGAAPDMRWFSISPKAPADFEYLEKVQKHVPEEAMSWDRPHSEIMSYLSRARALFVMGSESFSIVAAEANSYGVPVIIGDTQPNHVTLEACSAGAPHSVHQIKYKTHGERLEQLRQVAMSWKDPSLSDREEVLEKTWERYNPEASLARLEFLMKKAITAREGAPRGFQTEADALSMFGGV